VAGIQLGGLSSGLDTQSIIQGLMQVESAPRTQIVNLQTKEQKRHDELQQVSDKLNALKLASDSLGSVLTWAPTQTATPSDSTKATARMISGAGPGSYAVNVTQLASGEQRTFAYAPSASDETYTLNGKSLTVTAGESVDAIASAINADTTYGAYAVNAGGNLVLASRTTGSSATINLAGGTTLTENVASRKAAKDAMYNIDGTDYTSSTNTISSASGAQGFIFGVELNLTGTGSFNVSVSPPAVDKTQVTNTVKSFVDAYNSAIDLMQQLTSEKSVPDAAPGSSDMTKGVLFSDDGLDDAMQQMRSLLATYTQPGATNSLYDQLNEIGISTGAPSGSATFSQDSVNGKLVLDTTKLSAALDADPQSVQALIGGNGNGFGQAFSAVLNPFVQTGGVFPGRLDSSNDQLKDYTDQIAEWDQRLSDKQNQLTTMFTNMELALQKTKSQGSELLAKLGVSSDS
jgi:flagellar hook-associated protein 2